MPWDQLAYWAVTVGTNMAEAMPLVGEKLKLLLLGGHSINANALLRFYVLHCVVLPLALVARHLACTSGACARTAASTCRRQKDGQP